MDYLQAMHRREQKIARNNAPVLDVFEALRDYALDFERELDNDHEVGARLVAFGSAITFHVDKIGYTQPSVITFDGVTEEGGRVKLVQHVSQLSVLFIAVPVRCGRTKQPIGFVNGL